MSRFGKLSLFAVGLSVGVFAAFPAKAETSIAAVDSKPASSVVASGVLAPSMAPNACADDHQQLGQLVQKLIGQTPFVDHWVETTADDGKPLKIEMSARDSKLYFVFDKTEEGVWAEGPATVCPSDDVLLVKLSSKSIVVGKAAPRLIRWMMSDGATFRLKLKDAKSLHVSTTGWSGDFVPR